MSGESERGVEAGDGKPAERAAGIQRKNRWRRASLLVLALLVLGLGMLGVLSALARRAVSEEALVRMAEGEIDSRVQIGSSKLSLFRLPAVITLKDVALAPRDAEVGKPLKERAPLSDPPVQVKEVRLAVNLGALLGKRVEVSEFVFEDPRLAVTLYEEGGTSLDDLLKSPDKRKKKRGSGAGEEDEEDKDVLNTRSLNVYAHGFLGRLKDVRMENGSVDFIIEKTGMVAKVRELDARLDEIDLDPSAIERTNTARVQVEGRVEIDSVDGEVRYTELPLAGRAEAKLFDPATGDLDLDLLGDFEFGEEAYVNAQIPVVQKGWRALQKLDAIGIRIGDLPERATFGRSGAVAIHYHRERFTLRRPLSVWFKDWEVAILEGTWIQSEQATHFGRAEIIAARQLSEKLHKQIGRGVEHVPAEFRPALVEEVEATWFRDGRLLAELESEGELTSPDVDVLNKFPDVKEVLKRGGEDFLKRKAGDLLKDLLDRE